MNLRTDTILWDDITFAVGFRSIARRHQGVSVRLFDNFSGRQLLRFDCYDDAAHYHYDPDGANERFWLDRALAMEPRDWMLTTVSDRLPQLVAHVRPVRPVKPPSLDFLLGLRRLIETVDARERQTLFHEQSEHLIEACGFVFGLSYVRTAEEEGVSLKILKYEDGRLIELVGFDCFNLYPHYHYGPQRRNIVIPIDAAAIGDPLAWALGQLASGHLPAMIEQAGYLEYAQRARDADLVDAITIKIKPLALRMTNDNKVGED